ncbi:universal stress protein A [Actinoplanes ianthinogenes]|uniref:Universal stress protein A n=1 Tax=Actinoplanes ianthinogenes TaxID=122358 RepID=A0ABM7M810_9ACTN|nr:universal stress protein [Actinoplanes ianthinogenes]BCJ47800.1 universal stress protein A [Actinoplanes ianthinogenes]GGR04234.1 universal stress protein A [Actinoplanes ianthinogenes]
MRPSVIVAGVDGSDSSMRAGAYAVGLARRQGSRLVGVFVRPAVGGVLSFADPSGAAVTAALATHEQMERDFRDTLLREQPRLGVDFEMVVRHGDPFSELCQVADEMWADAVIVGRPERALHRIAGSVAHRLVRYGRWPVTVVP